MNGLNFKGFKKVAHDEKTATFRNDKGHEIKIAHKHLSKELQKQLQELPHYDDGGEVDDGRDPASFGEDAMNVLKQFSPAPDEPTMADVQPATKADYGAQAAPQPEAAPQAQPQYEGPAVASQPQQDGGLGMLGGYANAYMKGVGQQKEALLGTAGIEQPLGENIAKQEESYGNYLHGQPGGFGDVMQNQQEKAFARRDEFAQDVRNKFIDPNRIFHDRSLGQKVLTGVSLFLGGFGQGLVGGSNPGMDFLISQRDADIRAQEKNLGATESLYAHNLRDFGDRMDALNMTKINMNDALVHHIQAEAVRAGGQNAPNIALQGIGKLNQESAFLQSQIGRHGNGQNNIPDQLNQLRTMSIINPALAPYEKSMEERYVPGANAIAPAPVDQKTKDEISSRNALQQQTANLRQWARAHSGSLNPAEMYYGESLAKTVQDAYRRANGQGVFKPAEADFVNGIISDNPTAFLNKFRVDPGYRALEDSNRQALMGLYHGIGLGAPSGMQQIKSFRPKK